MRESVLVCVTLIFPLGVLCLFVPLVFSAKAIEANIAFALGSYVVDSHDDLVVMKGLMADYFKGQRALSEKPRIIVQKKIGRCVLSYSASH